MCATLLDAVLVEDVLRSCAAGLDPGDVDPLVGGTEEILQHAGVSLADGGWVHVVVRLELGAGVVVHALVYTGARAVISAVDPQRRRAAGADPAVLVTDEAVPAVEFNLGRVEPDYDRELGIVSGEG